MKKVIAVFLFLAFCLVMVSHTGKSPPLEKSKIETIIEKTSDVMAFESPVLNPINFEGLVITGGDLFETIIYNITNYDVVNNKTYQIRLYGRDIFTNKNHYCNETTQMPNKKVRCLFLYPNNKNI